MTVAELVEEGRAYRRERPTASRKAVRGFLVGRGTRSTAAVRDYLGRTGSAAATGPEGCLAAVVLMPVMAAAELFHEWWHRRRVDRAMRKLYPKRRERDDDV
jgi:hypothetical protein